ncbi:MAG: hypothetical protein JNL83_13260 [Myxococcales bacterium]|nr:hypothetical protein [Myxococcales bacterium]
MMLRALALVALSGTALAEPQPLPRASASVDLRLHVGDSEQDEVPHYGLYPSLVLGGTFRLHEVLQLEASVAAAKVTATWENIGGLANGYLGARLLLDPPPDFFPEGGYMYRWTIAAGVTLPLDRSLPGADCFMPEHAGGDSLVLDYGTNTACWDRSAYRRAMLHRGGWATWMWAPDFLSAVASARFADSSGDLDYSAEVGGALGVPITDAHDDTAVMLQLGVEVSYRLSPRWRAGGRAQIAGVMLDDESPSLVSLDGFVEYAPRGDTRLRAGVLVPLADLSNDDVPPGLGGYVPRENVSIGLSGVVTIDP